jgi:hypothetical protein
MIFDTNEITVIPHQVHMTIYSISSSQRKKILNLLI